MIDNYQLACNVFMLTYYEQSRAVVVIVSEYQQAPIESILIKVIFCNGESQQRKHLVFKNSNVLVCLAL